MIRIHEDRWLSSILARPVFRVDGFGRPGDDGGLNFAMDEVRRHTEQQDVAMYWAKVRVDQVGIVSRLARLGFCAVDVNVTFALDCRRARTLRVPAGIRIANIRTEEHADVLQIAKTAFEFDRYHLDPQIPSSAADKVKHDWILNYINKARGDRLLVASLDGRAVGFLAVLRADVDGKTCAVIDLVGVDRAFRRRGFAAALVAGFAEAYRDDCDELRVGTQIANIPSIRLYEGVGFTLHSASYVLHMHVVQGSHGG